MLVLWFDHMELHVQRYKKKKEFFLSPKILFFLCFVHKIATIAISRYNFYSSIVSELVETLNAIELCKMVWII